MVASAADPQRLGEIEFFGYKGLDLQAVRAVLPLHEGDEFPPSKAKSSDALKAQVGAKIRQAIGRTPTDVSFVCCDSRQAWMVYIGLPGGSSQPLAFNPAPRGNARLPKAAVTLRERLDEAWFSAVTTGNAAEDHSAGYALTSDPRARAAQLAIREYALQNEPLVFQVLASSSDVRHRAIAAHMCGYGRQSSEQIDALVQASLDPNDGVRNDAVRALAVLADARPELAKRIPAATFVRLLRSGLWSDHNKAALLLLSLTSSRDPQLLAQLRAEASDSLLEMARWRSVGHAGPALSILGRLSGINEDALNMLIADGQTETIVARFNGK
jgi:hypothetical protein